MSSPKEISPEDQDLISQFLETYSPEERGVISRYLRGLSIPLRRSCVSESSHPWEFIFVSYEDDRGDRHEYYRTREGAIRGAMGYLKELQELEGDPPQDNDFLLRDHREREESLLEALESLRKILTSQSDKKVYHEDPRRKWKFSIEPLEFS